MSGKSCEQGKERRVVSEREIGKSKRGTRGERDKSESTDIN